MEKSIDHNEDFTKILNVNRCLDYTPSIQVWMFHKVEMHQLKNTLDSCWIVNGQNEVEVQMSCSYSAIGKSRTKSGGQYLEEVQFSCLFTSVSM